MGHLEPAARHEGRHALADGLPDGAPRVLGQVAEQQADPDRARLDEAPVGVERLEDEALRLGRHAHVAEAGVAQQAREAARLAGAHALEHFGAARGEVAREPLVEDAEPGHAVGRGPDQRGDPAARAEHAARLAEPPTGSGKNMRPSWQMTGVEGLGAARERLAVHHREADRSRAELRARAAQHREREIGAEDAARRTDGVGHPQRRLARARRQIEDPLAGPAPMKSS